MVRACVSFTMDRDTVLLQRRRKIALLIALYSIVCLQFSDDEALLAQLVTSAPPVHSYGSTEVGTSFRK